MQSTPDSEISVGPQETASSSMAIGVEAPDDDSDETILTQLDQQQPLLDEDASTGQTSGQEAKKRNNKLVKPSDHRDTVTNIPVQNIDTLAEGSWVAAIYDRKWYIGQVKTIDDDEAEIDFLEAAGKYQNAYKKPTVEDRIWCSMSNILMVLNRKHHIQLGSQNSFSKFCMI